MQKQTAKRGNQFVLKSSLLVLACASTLLAGCGALTPVPYTTEELRDRVALDRMQMYADQEPINGPISFHEAAARALKYNLDYKLKLMENALTQSLHDVSLQHAAAYCCGCRV